MFICFIGCSFEFFYNIVLVSHSLSLWQHTSVKFTFKLVIVYSGDGTEEKRVG
jgi:hypothetical protein